MPLPTIRTCAVCLLRLRLSCGSTMSLSVVRAAGLRTPVGAMDVRPERPMTCRRNWLGTKVLPNSHEATAPHDTAAGALDMHCWVRGRASCREDSYKAVSRVQVMGISAGDPPGSRWPPMAASWLPDTLSATWMATRTRGLLTCSS